MSRFLLVLSFLLTLVLSLTGPFEIADAPPTTSVVWRTGSVLDQGMLPACVATAWVGWLEADPHPTASPSYTTIYWSGQALDAEYKIPGPTIRTGERVMRELGLLGGLTYTNSITEATHFLITQGPIIVTSLWYEQMERIDKGLASTGGRVLGDHAYLCYGLDGANWLCQNSYGANWGDNGRFAIPAYMLQGTPWFEVALATKRLAPFPTLLPRQ